MLQRKQSILLGLNAVIMPIAAWLLDLWKESKEWLQAEDNVALLALYLLVALFSIISLFSFKNRPNQMKLNWLGVLLNLSIIGFMVFYLLKLPGGLDGSEKGIGLLIPVLSIVFLVIANRWIKADDRLVKSVDRFR